MSQSKKESRPGRRALRSLLIVVAGLVGFLLYSYATDVTKINLEEPLKPQRQEITTRVIRSLARPEFLEFTEETRSLNISIRMPCPEEPKGSQISLEGRLVTLSPNCASTTQDKLIVTGTGFRPRTEGVLRWYPPGEIETTRGLTTFRTDPDGNFSEEFTMPDIRPSDEPQRIEVEERWRTGIKGLSRTSLTTIEKITETVFLALMATTVGTVFAVPISFLAARNLMIRIGSPLAAIASALIALPIGAGVGFLSTGELLNLSELVSADSPVTFIAGATSLGVAAGCWVAAWAIIRVGPRFASGLDSEWGSRLGGYVALTASALLIFLGLGVFANLGVLFGGWLEGVLGSFDFLGRFLILISDMVLVLSPAVAALALGLVAASLGSHYGQEAVLSLDFGPARVVTAVLSAIGAAFLVRGLGEAYIWLYQPHETDFLRIVLPLGLGVVMGIVGGISQPKRLFPIGTTIYTLTRAALNIIRSIEPLIYVIVFAVWVGIGPFAGVLALTGHTIAALGKLFSEQVENISQGPIEAVTATGANSLQTVVFAVIPQIVPPYIAFTLYRWDINVRFSTVIGFGGGGGIGFVLFQHINLLQYSKASVMMIAIAIVVMSLDYISSQIRTRII